MSMFTNTKKRAREDEEELDELRHDHKVFALVSTPVRTLLLTLPEILHAPFPCLSDVQTHKTFLPKTTLHLDSPAPHSRLVRL